MRLVVAFLLFSSALLSAEPTPGSLALRSGWAIQSACQVEEKGDVISTLKFHPAGWEKAEVPGGVVANLVRNKVYPEPYFGTNLRQLPGTNYPVGTLFANRPMPDDSPFRCAWWYRTEIMIAPAHAAAQKWLHFDGINYRANIWVNGKLVANSQQVAGAWRVYEFNVTDVLVRGRNVLAVEVIAPTETDLGINWVDWNPTPPDKNMGLWRDVWLSFSGPVAVRDPQVITELSVPDLKTAKLTVTAQLRNPGTHPVTGIARVTIENIRLSQPLVVPAGQTRTVSFTPQQYPQLIIKEPRVWWPAPLGAQNLYKATVAFEPSFAPALATRRHVADAQTVTFGIRSIDSELDPRGHRLFKINGRNILIRGAGWTSDMLLNATPERIDEELRYVRHLNLNTVRLEGKLESDHFFEMTDRMGILVMAGWCCCDIWEQWPKWTDETRRVANESLRSQMLRLRNHPSLLVWLNGSDNPPPPDVETSYLAIEKELNWPNPVLSSAAAKPTTVSGSPGVKMSGPYEYVPPAYWTLDSTRFGGAYGFNSETSPGPAVPPMESIVKTVGKENLWPINDVWKYHCGGGNFKTLDVFTAALTSRYGEVTSAQQYSLKAQAMTYEGERAMFEAYGRNKYTSTGVIQWMLNNAWPSMIWHLYDWYLMPGGGYFGARKANEAVHVQYSYDDGSVAVVNSLYEPVRHLRVNASVYSSDMALKFTREVDVDVAEDGVTRALTIPPIDDLTTTYFLKLTAADTRGKLVSSNFYWLSTKADVLDWEKSNWYMTPTAQTADFTALDALPKVALEAAATTRLDGADRVAHVVLRNPSNSLAFLVRLRLLAPDGYDVLPILWDDNFVSLLPGEKREITGRFAARQLHTPPTIRLEGWNVAVKDIASK